MSVQSVTVQLPTRLYDQLKHRAEQAQRSIEAEMVDAVVGTLPSDDDLSADLQKTVTQLSAANDEVLRQTASARFPAEKSARLESLHLQRQAGDWNAALATEAATLTSEMEDFIFLRAHAMSLLMQRGHNPTDIVRE